MEKLTSQQRKYLKGLGHKLKPVVFVGQKGLSDSLVRAVDESLEKHELIKIKFIDFKEKSEKEEISEMIQDRTGSERVGMIGHMAMFYRQHPDPEKQKIHLPMKRIEKKAPAPRP